MTGTSSTTENRPPVAAVGVDLGTASGPELVWTNGLRTEPRGLAHASYGCYASAPPVSIGREAFSAAYLDGVLAGVGEVGTQDLVATLTELTAVTVARALAVYDVTEVVASGGGTHNPALMDALRRRLGDVPLVTSDERGLSPDAKESVLWALLGWLSWHGLPGATSATGATVPRILDRPMAGRTT